MPKRSPCAKCQKEETKRGPRYCGACMEEAKRLARAEGLRKAASAFLAMGPGNGPTITAKEAAVKCMKLARVEYGYWRRTSRGFEREEETDDAS